MLSRKIGDAVRINPYSQVTGEILQTKLENDELRYDYKVKLYIPYVDKDTIYSANYDAENSYWWNYFDEDELDKLERNYAMVVGV